MRIGLADTYFLLFWSCRMGVPNCWGYLLSNRNPAWVLPLVPIGGSMRHGWKTRMDERQYFETKRYEREERQQMMQLIKMKMDQDLSLVVAKMQQEKEMH